MGLSGQRRRYGHVKLTLACTQQLLCLTPLYLQVLITVPLTLLQQNFIQFNPPLPERKLKAIYSLGTGIIEKVIFSDK